MPTPTGRAESRHLVALPLWLTSLENAGVFEAILTEDVSLHGSRVVSRQSWRPRENVLITSPPETFVRAQIVYCYRLPNEQFVAGIRLQDPPVDWLMSSAFILKDEAALEALLKMLSHKPEMLVPARLGFKM